MGMTETRKGEPVRYAVCDCETDPFKVGRKDIAPFLWGFWDGETYQEFETTESFVAFAREFDGIIYAHNGGKFDWHFLLPHIDPLQEILIISGRIAKARMGAAELRDSYSILPVPLSAWAKDKIDYAIFEADQRNKPKNRKAIRHYLRKDCEYLYDMVSAFLREFGLYMTLAGASMGVWEKLRGEKAPRSSERFYNDMHRYYYGGRVQCFRYGVADCRFKVADINSAYPRAMLERHAIDTDCTTIRQGLTQAAVAVWIKARGAGQVFVSILARSRGAFPFRADDGALYFPSDNVAREYHVTAWEYLAAMETGTADILRVTELRAFAHGITFDDYILPFYEKRKAAKAAGDKAGDLLSKLMMNANYGKWASNPAEYESFVNVPPKFAGMLGTLPPRARGKVGIETTQDADLSGYEFAGLLGPWALGSKPLPEEKRRYYNVATAASITGWVRAYLWRTLCCAVNPIYCDTDSIAAEAFGDGVPFGGALGEWKDEGSFDRYAVGGKKMYAFRYVDPAEDGERVWKTASKGVRLSAADVERIASGEAVEYLADKPTFSVHHEPRLINRHIKMTEKNLGDSQKQSKKKRSKKVDA